MKKKTQQLTNFIDELHDFIVNDPQFRKDTSKKSESVIQGEVRPLMIRYTMILIPKVKINLW